MKGGFTVGDTLTYKGYEGSVEYSAEDNCLFGKVLGIKSLLLYEGSSVDELRKDFKESVDEYLKECVEDGVSPEIPYKGTFNIRIGPELHKAVDVAARKRGCSMNALIKDTLAKELI